MSRNGEPDVAILLTPLAAAAIWIAARLIRRKRPPADEAQHPYSRAASEALNDERKTGRRELGRLDDAQQNFLRHRGFAVGQCESSQSREQRLRPAPYR